MNIRIRRGAGNYGHNVNGIIRPKSYDSGAFEVDDATARRLCARGIAEAVETAETAPVAAPAPMATKAAPAPTPAGTGKAKSKGKAAKPAKRVRRTPADSAKPDMSAPSFDAAAGIV